MKEVFEMPEIVKISFGAEDILTTSTPVDTDDVGQYGGEVD